MSNERLNSDIILCDTRDFQSRGELETIKRELELLRNVVAYLSNQMNLDQIQLQNAIYLGYMGQESSKNE
jgi:hypothetical protein